MLVLNISEIAYNSGFENMSNFNRQFRTIKGVTPSEYQQQLSRSSALSSQSAEINLQEKILV